MPSSLPYMDTQVWPSGESLMNCEFLLWV